MNIQFDNIHSPDELRALSEALNKIADVREALRVEFRLQAARDRVAEQPVAETAQEEAAAPAPKRQRAAKASSPAAETAPASETTSAPASAPAATTSETTSQPDPTPTATTAATEAITLEEVRAKLASLSQAGKAADVKALLAKFGVAKLTEVPAEKFAELLAQAEALA